MRAVSVHGLTTPPSGPGVALVMYLIATSETPNSAPAAAPRSSPSARCRTRRRVEIRRSAAPSAKIAHSTAISADSEARCGWLAPSDQSDEHQPRRGDRHTDPLPSLELEAEVPLCEHGEQDEPAGEDRLNDREWRERDRANVQQPGDDRHDPPDREPSGAKEIGGARSGWLTRIGGASTAPRCLNRKATLVPSAEAKARISPRIMARGAVCEGESLPPQPPLSPPGVTREDAPVAGTMHRRGRCGLSPRRTAWMFSAFADYGPDTAASPLGSDRFSQATQRFDRLFGTRGSPSRGRRTRACVTVTPRHGQRRRSD
jgi:hypothetical protein